MPTESDVKLQQNQIHQGDCIELLRQLDEEVVDLVFADPPFNIGYEYDVYDDRRAAEDFIAWCRQWIDGVFRALKPNGTFWLAIGDEYAARTRRRQPCPAANATSSRARLTSNEQANRELGCATSGSTYQTSRTNYASFAACKPNRSTIQQRCTTSIVAIDSEAILLSEVRSTTALAPSIRIFRDLLFSPSCPIRKEAQTTGEAAFCRHSFKPQRYALRARPS